MLQRILESKVVNDETFMIEPNVGPLNKQNKKAIICNSYTHYHVGSDLSSKNNSYY